MKTLPLILTGLLATQLTAAPAVSVRGVITQANDHVTLDLFTDITEGLALRTFGLTINYDSAQLTATSLGRYEELWFLSPDSGNTKLPYSEATVIKPGVIKILGARFDGGAPTEGVSGQQVLLGSFSFDRNNNDPVSFELGLAKEEPFTNFTLADGTSVDANLEGIGGPLPITLVDTPADSDNDNLPDAFEIATFGSIKETSGDEDSENDRRSNYQEWLAGTDPTDAASNLKLIMTLQPDGSNIFEWSGLPDRVYTLTRSDSLEDFDPIVGAIPGIPNHLITEPADAASKAFYRLQVENPTAR